MANPVVKLIPNQRPWGSTSDQVMLEVSNLIYGLNSPPPFETEPDPPDWNTLFRNVSQICEKATTDKRKGMMISSRFRVDQRDKCVEVWHVRNEKEPKLFLTIQPA